MNILFICTANISRSFLAEKLFQHEVEKRHMPDVSVSSAGIVAMPGAPPDPRMVDYLKALDVLSHGHESRPLDETLVSWADRILVMEKIHYQHIEGHWPDALDKLEMLGKYVAMDGSEDDVIDPYGRSPYHYRLAQSQIRMAVETLANKIQPEQSGAF